MSGSLVPHSPTALELAPDGASNAVQSWGPPAAPAPPAQGAVNFARYFAAVRRYKWLIAVIVLLGTIGGVAATQIIKPLYRVNSTVVIGDSPDPKGPVRPQVVLKEAAWRELMLSYAILDPVARETGMYLTPTNEADSVLFRGFQPTSDLQPGRYILNSNVATKRYDLAIVRGRTEASVETGALGDSIGRTVGFAWAPDASLLGARASEVKFEVRTPREAANDLRNRLNVQLIAIHKSSGEIKIVPRAEDIIRDDDLLIILGEERDLDRFREVGRAKG